MDSASPPFSRDELLDLMHQEALPFAEREALLWQYQNAHNPVLRAYCDALGTTEPISLPIAFFKQYPLQTKTWEPEHRFASSGTTGQQPSQHLVRSLADYGANTLQGFHRFFPEQRYVILGLLPSYLERGNSSLVYMVQHWIQTFGLPGSGFFLDDFEALRKAVRTAEANGQPILLIGVAFALLDLAEDAALPLPPNTIVLETGGMKGRRKELVREALHRRLKASFGLPTIYSEYGMTELLSQAYSDERGRFRPSPTLRAWVSDVHLDRLVQPPGIVGRLHLVDLANLDSCGFIATDDLGRMHPDGTFEVLGRLDTAEMRGCSLMYEG
ncbi:MAG: acyl transferase [Bacteroidota bacterium]